jgi:hypothetical protein
LHIFQREPQETLRFPVGADIMVKFLAQFLEALALKCRESASNQATTISFHFFPNSLHINHPTIRRYVFYQSLYSDGMDGPGSIPGNARFFSSPQHRNRFWGLSNLLSNRYRGLFPRRVKRPGREADHLSPSSAEVKKTWITTSTPHTSGGTR